MSKGWILDDPLYSWADEWTEDRMPFVHADTRNEARRRLSSDWDIPYIATVVYRYPIIDDLHVTPAIGLSLGIFSWHSCFGKECGREIRMDETETMLVADDMARGVTFAVFDWQGRVYCSPECAGFATDAFTANRLIGEQEASAA